MKTQEQILERIESLKGEELFGTTSGDLLDFLTFDLAKSQLKEGATEDQWKKQQKVNDVATIKKEITDYLPFAWEKANNCRGLSASRSIDHFKAYLWLLDDGSFEKMEAIEYEHYGKEKLIFVSELVGFNWKSEDDGIRTNTDS